MNADNIVNLANYRRNTRPALPPSNSIIANLNRSMKCVRNLGDPKITGAFWRGLEKANV